LRIDVLSNIPDGKSTQQLRGLLDHAGLLALLDTTTIVSSQDAGASKPDPRINVFTAERAGVPSGQCLYVGEDPAEVKGTRQAGTAGLVRPAPIA
jgi:FMN phosphatase YigB (HAD superfamily)